MGTLNTKKMGLKNSRIQDSTSCCVETALEQKALVDCIIEEESQTKIQLPFDFRYINTEIPYGVDNYNVKVQKLILSERTLENIAHHKKASNLGSRQILDYQEVDYVYKKNTKNKLENFIEKQFEFFLAKLPNLVKMFLPEKLLPYSKINRKITEAHVKEIVQEQESKLQQTVVKEINKELDAILTPIKLVIGCWPGYLSEHSLIQKTETHNFGKLTEEWISSMTVSSDKRWLFVADYDGKVHEFDMLTHTRVENFEFDEDIWFMKVTNDDKYLICGGMEQDLLIQYDMETKQKIHTWSSNINKNVCSLTNSYDGRFLFIGYPDGYFAIRDLKKNQTVLVRNELEATVWSIAVARDNKHAYLSDWRGNITKVQWTIDEYDEMVVEFPDPPVKLGGEWPLSIELAQDDKSLLICARDILRVWSTEKREVTHRIVFGDTGNWASELKLINNDSHAIAAFFDGSIKVVDLQKMELTDFEYKAESEKGIFRVLVL